MRREVGRAISWRGISVTAFVVCAFLSGYAWTPADADLWGHLRFGLDLWETGQVVRDDPYSYLTRGSPWINHEWLAEGIFAATYAVGGPPGLIALKAVLGLAVLALAFRHLCRRGVDVLGAGLLVSALALPMRPGLLTVRPHIFTYLAFLLLLLWIERAERGPSRWRWGLVPLFAVWANLHGGILAGLAFVLAWATLWLAV